MKRANEITTTQHSVTKAANETAKAANGTTTTTASTKSTAANGTNTTLGSNTTTSATALTATTTARPTTAPKINHVLKPHEDGKNGTLERNITFCVSCCPLPNVGIQSLLRCTILSVVG